MSNIDLRRKDLDPEAIERVSQFMTREGNTMLERLQDLDKRLTNTNFLTNGGGAVAVLAFLSNHGNSLALKISLFLFTVGVIATGIELRAMLIFLADVAADNRRRFHAFLNNEVSYEALGQIPVEVGKLPKKVNHYAGVVSQIVFVLGVIVGAIGFII